MAISSVSEIVGCQEMRPLETQRAEFTWVRALVVVCLAVQHDPIVRLEALPAVGAGVCVLQLVTELVGHVEGRDTEAAAVGAWRSGSPWSSAGKETSGPPVVSSGDRPVPPRGEAVCGR